MMTRLDDLVIEALVAQPLLPPPSDSFPAMEVFEDDDDIAATHRFIRASLPYERIELSSSTVALRRPATFVKTVRTPLVPAATLSFDKVWFEQSDDVIAATEDVTPIEHANSWLWLGLSLLGGAFAVAILQYLI